MLENLPAVGSIPSHMFVVDGLAQEGTQDYYHINAGWGGTDNGWYLLTDVLGDPIDGALFDISPEFRPLFETPETETIPPTNCEIRWSFPRHHAAAVQRFRILEGTETMGDTVWTTAVADIPGTDRSHAFASLAPGTHLFAVEASRDGTGWDPTNRSPEKACVVISGSGYLWLANALQRIAVSGGNGSFQIVSDGAWNAGADVPWITVASGSSGTGDGVVTYSVEQNASGLVRTGHVTVTCGALTRTHTVEQLAAPDVGRILHVKPTGDDGADGLTWAMALRTLQAALAAAVPGDEVWLAQGTYKPNDVSGSLARNQWFQLKNGVAVYGGFDGTEHARSARDPSAHPTVLSGDLLGDDQDIDGNGFKDPSTTDDNCYHVLCHNPELAIDSTAVLDGVTVSGGNANATVFPDNCGGGINNIYGSPKIANCILRDNSANWGGAVYSYANSFVTISNSVLVRNSAAYMGGAVHTEYQSSPKISACSFTTNKANNGGAMANFSSSSTITRCTVSGNFAYIDGGGMYNKASSPLIEDSTFSANTADSSGAGLANEYGSCPAVSRCTFSSNAADSAGGGMYNYSSSSPVITACTLNQNSAFSYGGGIYNYSSAPTITACTLNQNSVVFDGGGIYNSSASPVLLNCVLWDNSKNQIYNRSSSSPAVTNCVIQGGYAGGTNILTGDPLLRPLGPYGGPTWTMPPRTGSSAIDTGLAGPGIPTEDQRGFPRDAHPDIGACEFQTLLVSSDLDGPAPIGGHPTFTAFTDLDGASFQWFAGASGDPTQPLSGQTNAAFTTAPLDLGADFWVGLTSAITNLASVTQAVSVRGTYPEWVAFHGLAGSGAEPGASPAGDGIANLIKFASGLNPHTLCAAADYSSLSMNGASNNLSFIWIQSKTPTDIACAFRQSTDLRTWSPAAFAPTLVESNIACDAWEITAPIDTNRFFLDVEITRVVP